MQTRCKLEWPHDAALRTPGCELSLRRHALRWCAFTCIALIACTAPWWWQRLAAVPLATAVLWLTRCRPVQKSLIDLLELVPYFEPVRGSRRTGRLVYQFVRISPHSGENMTTTLEQLIASFLQIGLAKVDGKLSATTQQMLSNAVPTLVATIASVIVDLAENHKTTKTATSPA